MTASTLKEEEVRHFFERYLLLNTGGREHVTVLFYDIDLPSPFLKGLDSVNGTRLLGVDVRRITDPANVLAELWEPDRRYLSVHDYCAAHFFPQEKSAATFARIASGMDFTSFEFPRFDLTAEQIELLIARYIAGDPQRQRAHADNFYARLGSDPCYVIEVHSGLDLDRTLHIQGPSPWMEICGPLLEGDLRFAPGCELFYNGHDLDGSLYCDGAVNLLPLRGARIDEGMCRQILRLAQHLSDDPIQLDFRRGELTHIRSDGGLGASFEHLLSCDEAFSWAVEVGIGLLESGGPLIREWAASTNEAVPGVHVGLGADPGNPQRFRTGIHFDFVAPRVQITVNGQVFFDRGVFVPLPA